MVLLNQSIAKKMLLFGVFIILVIFIQYIFNISVNSKIKSANNIARMRKEQLLLTSNLEKNLYSMILAAMDSIIDRDEGKMDEERIDTINRVVSFVQTNRAALLDAVDTEKEKRDINNILSKFSVITKIITQDLKSLIENSSVRKKEIEQSFHRMDDTLDDLATVVEEKLTALFEIISKEQKDATASLNFGRKKLAVLEDMMESANKLMMFGMDQMINNLASDSELQKEFAGQLAIIKKLLKDSSINISDAEERDIKNSLKVLETIYFQDLLSLIRNRAPQTQFIDINERFDGEAEKLLHLFNNIYERGSEELSKNIVVTEEKIKEVGVVNGLLAAHFSLMLNAMDSIIDKDAGEIEAERLEQMKDNTSFINQSLPKIKKLIENDEEAELVSVIVKNYRSLLPMINTDLKSLIENAAVELIAIEKNYDKIDDDIDVLADELIDSVISLVKSIEDEDMEESENLLKMIGSSSFVSSVTFLLVAAFVIVGIISIIRSIIPPLKKALQDLQDCSGKVAASSGEIATSSQEMAGGASEQASSLEEVSSSLEEMSSMTKQNADNAREADNMAGEVNNSAREGAGAMEQMSRAITRIKESSDETEKIIKTINEIAFQTNLLALNAAVEAARAGEAGKGFAVVAEEVRNLATRSADAAKNTSELIASAKRNSNRGVEATDKVNEVLSAISDSIGKLVALIQEVSVASNEQASGIEQINTAVSQMDQVTQSNAASAEESASAAQELSSQVNALNKVVSNINLVVEGKN